MRFAKVRCCKDAANTKNSKGHTPLHIAAQLGNKEGGEKILEAGGFVDHEDNVSTLLHVHVHVHVCTCMYVHVQCMYVCMYVCMYTVHVCTCTVCMYVYVYLDSQSFYPHLYM